MGTPARYSVELPERCLQLINELWSGAEKAFVSGQEHLGPLTTTFLLAMATPIILQPIERIERHRGREDRAYMNERLLDDDVTAEVDRVLANGTLGSAPFFERDQWRYTSVTYSGQNLALQIPDELCHALTAPSALLAASRMQASLWTSCLRNALAHGGVLYLDRQCRHDHGGRAEILAFVSARFHAGMANPPSELRVLCVTEEGFRSFLQNWIEWIGAIGLSQRMAA